MHKGFLALIVAIAFLTPASTLHAQRYGRVGVYVGPRGYGGYGSYYRGYGNHYRGYSGYYHGYGTRYQGYSWYGPGIYGVNGYYNWYAPQRYVYPYPYVQPTYQSFYQPYGTPAAQERERATVEVRVPAGAEIYFDGVRTTTTGTDREFSTPPLKRGTTYEYAIRMNHDGKEETKNVTVRAGERSIVDFRSTSTP